MVLRNKDGSTYRLQSPNALMKNQSIWTDYTLHNMKWNSIEHKNNQVVNKMESNLVLKDTFVQELEMTKNEILNNSINDVEKKEAIIVKDKNVKGQNDIKKTFMFCLPAIILKKTDSLYNEEYNSIEYGNPFSFESIVIQEEDLYYKFWATLKIESESVIYPKSNTKRWWRVNSKEEKGNGFIYTCVPSNYQPHFEGV
jgi:hypothetical protein